MITNVSLVSVWVTDIDEALAFYTDILGFEARDDIQLGEDFRWVTVGHASQPELDLHLTTPSGPLSDDLIAALKRAQAEGGLPGVGLQVDDCRQTYQDLTAKGVEFIQEPQDRPYGVEALMRDNSGNWLVLVEPREFTLADFEGSDLAGGG
jgi:catechol 2,3-dioxygenase-like lactoylglutathione lyase family enzyme